MALNKQKFKDNNISKFHVLRIKARHHRVDLKFYHWKYFKSGVWWGIFTQTLLAFPCASPCRWLFNKLLELFFFCFFFKWRFCLRIGNKITGLKKMAAVSLKAQHSFKQKQVTIPQVIQKTAAFPFNGNQVKLGHSRTTRTSTGPADNNRNSGEFVLISEIWVLFYTPIF